MGRPKVALAEAHAAQDGLRPGLQFVAVSVLERGLESAQSRGAGRRRRRPAGEAGPTAAGAAPRNAVRVDLADLLAQFGDAALRVQDLQVRGQHLLDDGVIGDLLDLLRKEADAQVLAGADLARRRATSRPR